MKNEKDEFINYCINNIESCYEAMERNDYKTNNKLVIQLNKYLKENEDKNFFEDAIVELMNSKNIEVSFVIASRALKKKINVRKALKILKNVAKHEELGIKSFEAMITLQQYHNGEL